jgi:ADP-heptose:LPS heptosyltransferase
LGERMRYKFVNSKARVLVGLFDALGWVLVAPFRLFCHLGRAVRSKDTAPPRTMLLIRADYIGDVLLTTQTLPKIRAAYPDTRIFYLVSRKSRMILDNNPYVDEVITYDPFWFFKKSRTEAVREYLQTLRRLRAARIELAVDFRGDLRNIALLMFLPGIPQRLSFAAGGGGFLLTRSIAYPLHSHESHYHNEIARALGADVTDSDLPQVFLSERDQAVAREFVESRPELHKPPVVVIHPGARTPMRLWPAERYAAVGCYAMDRHGAAVVLIGAPDELPRLLEVNRLMQERAVIAAPHIASLAQLTALFRHCHLYIGVSSGPSHLAAVAGLDSLLLFGPETEAQWRPMGNRHLIVKKHYPCCPCTQKRCEHPPPHCIAAIRPEDLYPHVDAFLDRN